MSAPAVSLHHVTATVDRAQPDLDFFAGLLGLRLVKRTVNFDNASVYHFYYGDELGRPGTVWTTFPYHGKGVRIGVHGAGQITATALSVRLGTIGYWTERLAGAGVAAEPLAARFDEVGLRVRDPSGLVIELVEGRDDRPGWAGAGVDSASAVRGLAGVTLLVRDPPRTVEFLTGLLGLRVVGTSGRVTRVTAGPDRPGHRLDVRAATDEPDARNGLGTVHHVALAVPDAAAQLAIREEVVRRGIDVTPVRDRQYFQSIYFREPGGVLLEIATVAPGFTLDEPADQLGAALRLPPWEEPNRPTIEAALPRITVPRGPSRS